MGFLNLFKKIVDTIFELIWCIKTRFFQIFTWYTLRTLHSLKSSLVYDNLSLLYTIRIAYSCWLYILRWGTHLFMSLFPSVRPSVCPSVAHYISGTVHMWSLFLVHMCKMMITPRLFFIFAKILVSWVVKGVKEQKLAQNKKWELHPSRIVSQEQCSIWSWFLVQLCEMMISPGDFFIFSKFQFFGF